MHTAYRIAELGIVDAAVHRAIAIIKIPPVPGLVPLNRVTWRAVQYPV